MLKVAPFGVGSSSCRILFRCRCWRWCHCWHVSGCLDRGHHGHISSTRPHGIGATYLDGYGERREGNGELELLATRPCWLARTSARRRRCLGLEISDCCLVACLLPLRFEGRVETGPSLLSLHGAAGCHSLCPRGLLSSAGLRVVVANRQCETWLG